MDPNVVLAITFLAIALVLALLEIFLPSLGMLAFASVGTAVAAVWFAFRAGPTTGWIFTALVLVLAPVVVWAGFKLLPYTPIGRRLILAAPTAEEVKGSGAYRRDLADMVGKQGTVISQLRPSGIAIIDGRRLDVTTEGLLIEKDEPVRVVRVQGNQLIVDKVTGPRDSAPPAVA